MPPFEEPEQVPPRSSVGLRDVARAAGVSTATVSRVFNNPTAVSPKLRARVRILSPSTSVGFLMELRAH